jgi:hypothetical protein
MAANQTPADVIAAMYQQYLSGGTTPELWQGNVTGPQVPGMSVGGGGGSDGGASGFAELGQGLLDYLGDEDEDVKEKTSGILNQSAWTPEDAQPPAGGQMAPPPGQQPAPNQFDNSPVTSSVLPPPAGAPQQQPPPAGAPQQQPPVAGPPQSQPTPEQTKAATNVVNELSYWMQKLLTPP